MILLVAMVISAGLLAICIRWLPTVEGDRRFTVGLALASLATRALVPWRSIHIQTDDLNLVAFAQNIAKVELGAFNSPDGLMVPLVAWVLEVFSGRFESVFLIGSICGTLFPMVSYLFALRWFEDLRLAKTVSICVLLSPVALVYSGAITAYMPASFLFALAMWTGLGRGYAWEVVSTLILFVASLLKPEFLLLLPAHAGLLYAHSRRLASFRPACVVAVVICVFFTPYASIFSWRATGRVSGLPGDFVTHAFGYLISVLVFNPPFIPFKLVFLKSLWKPEVARVRPLQIFSLGFIMLYLLSTKSGGLNQWRHSLVFMVPFYMSIAPILTRWWSRRGPRDKGFFASCVLVVMIAMLFYGDAIRKAPDTSLFGELDGKTLVLYGDHEADQSPSNLFAAIGIESTLSFRELWPSTCSIGSRVHKKYLQLKGLDWLLKSRMLDAHKDLILDEERWVSVLPKLSRGEELKMRYDEFSVDEESCTLHVRKMAGRLAPYDRIFVYIDVGVARARQNADRIQTLNALLPMLDLNHPRATLNLTQVMEIARDGLVLTEELNLGAEALVEVDSIIGMWSKKQAGAGSMDP